MIPRSAARNGRTKRFQAIMASDDTNNAAPTAAKTFPVASALASITEIYAAFGRGDVPTILDKVAADCRWESWTNNYAQKAGVASLRPQTGPTGVA